MKSFLTSVLCVLGGCVMAQHAATAPDGEKQRPHPPSYTELYADIAEVTPGAGTAPPSDAVVLFDGSGLNKWQSVPFKFPVRMEGFKRLIPELEADTESTGATWRIEENELIVVPGSGAIATRQEFGDVQLHVEWMAPESAGKKGQQYSNSGIFLMGLYEIQVLNSYKNATYTNGQAGSVYKQHMPLVNASRPPGEWQAYDILFTAPRFTEKGTLISPAKVTVLHNGVLVQYHVPLTGPTAYIGNTHYIQHGDKLPLVLQDHGDPVRFRNIWVREL